MKNSILEGLAGRFPALSPLWVVWLLVNAFLLVILTGIGIQGGRLASAYHWICFTLMLGAAVSGAVLWLMDARRQAAHSERLQCYRQMLEHVAVPLAMTGSNGGLLFVNEAWSDRLGPEPSGSAEVPWDLGPIEPDDSTIKDRILKQGRMGGYAGAVQVASASGRRRRMRLTASVVRDRLHVPIGVAWVLTEVPEETHAADEVQRLTEIIAHSAEAIICSDTDDKITAWNAAATSVFGYAAEEAVGKSIDILIPDDLRHSYHEAMKAKAGERGIVEQLDTVRQHKDGSKLPVNLTVANLQDGEGNIVGRALTIRDISSQREMEQQLRQRAQKVSDDVKHHQYALTDAKKRHEELLQAVSHCVVMARGDGKVERVNEAVKRLLGYSDKQLEVMRVGDFHGRESAREMNDLMGKARREGPTQGVVELRTNDGSRAEVEARVSFYSNLDCYQIIYQPPRE